LALGNGWVALAPARGEPLPPATTAQQGARRLLELARVLAAAHRHDLIAEYVLVDPGSAV
jgi:hypothetical protein